jgi:hypothetical protein
VHLPLLPCMTRVLALNISHHMCVLSHVYMMQDFDWGGAHVPLVPGQKPHRGAQALEEAVWAEIDIPTFTMVCESACACVCLVSS